MTVLGRNNCVVGCKKDNVTGASKVEYFTLSDTVDGHYRALKIQT